MLATFGWFSNNEALIQAALVSTLLAFSFQVALRSGVYNFGGIGCWAIGGYTTGILVLRGWPVVPAMAVSVLAAGVVGLLLALVLGRLRALYLAMATVAFDLLIQILAGILQITGAQNGLFGIPILLGSTTLVIAVAICGGILWTRERGSTGRMLETMRVDERLAPTVGIDISRQRINAFVLSSMLAALSGAINVLLFSTLAPAQAGFDLLVTTLMMVVIGGISSWIGPLLGAFIVTWLPDLLTFIGDWWPAVQGFIVLVMVVFAPDGIVGLLRDGFRRSGLRAAVRRLRSGPLPPELATAGAAPASRTGVDG
jgi:branched-chain amino acid transport system permease protein